MGLGGLLLGSESVGLRWARWRWVPTSLGPSPFSLLSFSLSFPAVIPFARLWYSFLWTACSSLLLRTLSAVSPPTVSHLVPDNGCKVSTWSIVPSGFPPCRCGLLWHQLCLADLPLFPHCVGRALPPESSFAPVSLESALPVSSPSMILL